MFRLVEIHGEEFTAGGLRSVPSKSLSGGLRGLTTCG